MPNEASHHYTNEMPTAHLPSASVKPEMCQGWETEQAGTSGHNVQAAVVVIRCLDMVIQGVIGEQ